MAVYDMPTFKAPRSLLYSIKHLPQNPTLPPTPLGQYTDALFAAEDAQLRFQTQQKYASILKALGYIDPSTGQVVEGDVERESNRQRLDLQRNKFLAGVEAINQAQGEGNYFSGFYGTNRARMEHPFLQALSDLDVDTPRALSDLFSQGESTISDYVLQRNLALAQAAGRQAQRIIPGGARPPGDEPSNTVPSGGGGVGTSGYEGYWTSSGGWTPSPGWIPYQTPGGPPIAF